MRLAVTVRLSLNTKQISTVCRLFLLLLLCAEVSGQDLQIDFGKGTPLSEALLQSSRTFHFKVAFDARSLSALSVSGPVSGSNTGAYLSQLLQSSGFSYVYKHGSYLVFRVAADSLKPRPAAFQLQGSVVDAETGEQLPFASLAVPEQNIQCSATTNGTFSIKNIISNPMRLVVSYIGYTTADTLIAWSEQGAPVRIRLRPQAVKITPVDVISSKLEIIDYRNDVDFATTVNAGRLGDMPVLAETDIFRTLQLLPGIRYSENNAELSIRGGTSDQNLVLFDGQTLYNLSHYYGVFSSINPNMVKDIQVYKGGFDSRYGERISGIVDITGKSGNRMKPSFTADLNLLSINLAAEVPVTPKLTLVAAVRRSYSDIYSTRFARNLFNRQSRSYKSKPGDSVVTSEPTFRFYDFNAKLNYRISPDQNLSLSLYGGKDYFRNTYLVKAPEQWLQNTDSSRWSNFGASMNWQRQWNPSFFSSVLVGASGYANTAGNRTSITRLTTGGEEYLPDSQNVFLMHNRNELTDKSFSIRNAYTVNSYNQLHFGFLYRNTEILYYKDADKMYVYDNNRNRSGMASVYAQDRISLPGKILLKPGFRATWFGGTGKVYTEPRLAVQADLSENLSFRLATGRYYQFISQVQSLQETGYTRSFWVMANDSVNPVLKAAHAVAGITWEKKKFRLDAEVYYKKSSGLQEYIYVSNFLRNTPDFGNYFPKSGGNPPPEEKSEPAPSYFISGTGKSYGLDLFMSYSARRYTGWFSYSLSKSVQQFSEINDGAEIPALTDQTHQVSVTNMFTPGKWNLGAVLLFQTGRPYASFTDVKMDGPITRKYSRMSDYFRCDVSANYNFTLGLIRFKAGMSVINLFDNRNYYDVNSRTFDFENTSFTETNLIPSQRLSLNLFLRISL